MTLRFARTAFLFPVLLLMIDVICGKALAESPLNVVFILVDDLGWSDLGYAGSDFYETPNIDALSRQSLVFRNAYAAAPVCSPTRAAILTGKSPARLDLTIWHEGAVEGGPTNRKLLAANSVANLPRKEVTLAERFRSAGYATAHIGKWHLGTAAYYPEAQGFDFHVGGTFWGAPSTFFYPFSGKWNQRDPEIRYVPGLSFGKKGDYLPDRLTDKAIEVIEQNRDRPFFLNLWYYTVHSPIEAPTALIESTMNRPAGKNHKDPIYAAMVNRMDHNVGRVLQKIEQLELSDRTIVVFTSDNGGVDFAQRGIVPTSNAPMRSGKGTLYEGGIRVPLMIRWPNKAVGETEQLATSQDFVPTFAEMLGMPVDAAAAVEQDGQSLLPLINDPASELTERSLFWHFPHYYPRMTPGSAIRSGDWKLIHYYEDDQKELYDLRNDPGEHKNLAAANANKTDTLYQQLTEWRTTLAANEPTLNQ